MEALREKQIGNFIVKVTYDNEPINPREFDYLSTIYSNHRRYNPDNHDIGELLDEDGYLNMDGYVGLMVWMFEHSGCTFKTTELDGSNPFGDGIYARFDSGKFGVIAMPTDKAKEAFGKDWENAAKKYMEAEIKHCDSYSNGLVYQWEVFDTDGKLVDKCGGYYDIDDAFDYVVFRANCEVLKCC